MSFASVGSRLEPKKQLVVKNKEHLLVIVEEKQTKKRLTILTGEVVMVTLGRMEWWPTSCQAIWATHSISPWWWWWMVVLPVQHCNTTVMGHSNQWVGNSQYHTHTHRTCDPNTMVFTIPMLFPSCTTFESFTLPHLFQLESSWNIGVQWTFLYMVFSL